VLHVFEERDDEMVEMDEEMLTAKVLYTLQILRKFPSHCYGSERSMAMERFSSVRSARRMPSQYLEY
jgi:hypothetical protein